MDWNEWNRKIPPVDQKAAAVCQKHWDSLAKPLGSLGLLEDAVVKIAALTGDPDVRLNKRAAVVICADNGVVRQGVTQTGVEVTASVARNIAKGRGCINRFSSVAHTDVFPVDLGVAADLSDAGVLQRKISWGTNDITAGPAMTEEQAERALLTGIDLARELKEKGYQVLITGEMGIGNTTTSSAIAAVLLHRPIEEMTGRGAGLSDQGMKRKTAAIRRAIEQNRPNPENAFDVLRKVGGYDIAGMAGLFLGGALYRVPVLIDGFISSVAALVAARLCPDSRCAMFATHQSDEPASAAILKALNLRPLLYAGMRLGEGTGAVAFLPVIDLALELYHNMDTFEDLKIDQYKHLGGEKEC